MYAPAPNGILDDNGRLLPEVLAARRRGVYFDVGNGTAGHITWERAGRDGPCFLYAVGDQVVLPQRRTEPMTVP